MRILGTICECNPFHFGHQRLIQEAFSLGADALIGVLSGDFVQRGEPAILSKFDRAQEMVRQGFDLVFELPVRYALSSAEGFARGSVGLLDALGVVDGVLFGSESGQLKPLQEVADCLDEPNTLVQIQKEMADGSSFPVAQQRVIEGRLSAEHAQLLETGNNSLGIQYLRAMNRLESGMEPLTIQRSADSISAHELRLKAQEGISLSQWVPSDTAALVEQESGIHYPSYERTLLLKLRETPIERYRRIPDGDGGLADRLCEAASRAGSLEELYQSTKVRNYTMSRVKRYALQVALALEGPCPETVPYARLLAIGKNGKAVLNQIREKNQIPLSAQMKVLERVGLAARQSVEEEVRATDFYNLNRYQPLPKGEDYTRKLFVWQDNDNDVDNQSTARN